VIIPLAHKCDNEGLQKTDFAEKLAEELEKKNHDDLKKTIECIENELKSRFTKKYHLEPAFFSDVAYMVMGKAVFMIGKDLGYVS